MSKTIKVIDLLNKMAKNEKYRPKKIILGCWEYTFDGIDYQNNYITDKSGLLFHWCLEKILNDEVEIIEEESEIDIQGIEETKISDDGVNEFFYYTNRNSDTSSIDCSVVDVKIMKKINKLIEAVKYLDNKLKEKE